MPLLKAQSNTISNISRGIQKTTSTLHLKMDYLHYVCLLETYFEVNVFD